MMTDMKITGSSPVDPGNESSGVSGRADINKVKDGEELDKYSNDLKNLIRKGKKETSGADGKEEKKQHTAPGDVLLKGMSSQSPIEKGTGEVSKAERADLKVDVTELVDKIMVSCDGLKEHKEVRIVIKDSLLPKTELKIERSDGILHVEFSTASADSQQLLAGVQSDLQQRLTQRLGNEVLVEVHSTDMQGGDHNEGRSRQRRDLTEETKNR